MNKTFWIIIATVLTSALSLAQKKKELLAEVAQLKAKAAEIQLKLDEAQAAKEVNLDNELQKFSYAFGLTIGNNLKMIGYDSLAYQTIAVALEDVMKGSEKMEQQTAQEHVRTAIQQLEEEEGKRKSEEGVAFLTENAKREGIQTTESGLQYEVITEGTGPVPVATNKVKVHYTGMLIDGTVFDSSVERGEPIVFGVTGVIKGWQEALQLMPVGSKWKVYIPQELGYGPRGAGGGTIPPYAALVFDVELLAIEE